MDQQWFDTTGKQHLIDFFMMIEHAIQEGKQRGMKVKRIDANELIKVYRKGNGHESI